MRTTVENQVKTPTWAGEEPAQASGSGVVEIWVEGLWLKYRTKDPMRTLRKIADKGFAAYLQYEHGWIRLLPEDVEKLWRGEDVLVPFFLEPPRFQGCKAYALVTIELEDFL
jgi:hypothetical protein